MKKNFLPLILVLISMAATSQNPLLLKDVYAGATGSGIQQIVKTAGFTFFNAEDDDADADRGLYRTDGTTGGTIKLNLSYLPDPPPSPNNYASTRADKLTALGNKVIFAGDNFTNYGEIWASDGTQAGTVALERYTPAISSTRQVISDIAKVNNDVLYSVRNTDNHLLLKKTNGTPGSISTVYDFGTYPTGNAQVTLFNVVNNILYFVVYNGNDIDQLWRSDGTAAGTYILNDFGNTQYVASNLMQSGNNFYVMIVTPGTGNVLWKSDGTLAGTQPVKTIGTTGNNNYPPNAQIGGTFYFAGLDAANGKELWKSDGTSAGTVLVADINPGTGSSTPANLTVLNNILYFAANDGTGNKLWKFDGTTASLVKDINPAAPVSIFSSFVVSNNSILLNASTATGGAELWITDGTTANTIQVADINPGAANSSPSFLTPGNPVYFSANNGVNGNEIFRFNNPGILPNKLYVNDGSLSGDVFTSAIGNNSNNGSAFAPFATPDYAYSIAQPGDTIYVDAGTYDLGGLTYSFPKPVVFLGTNYLVSPNDPSNKLLPNAARNAESIFTNGKMLIASNGISIEGFTWDAGNRTGIELVNTLPTNNDFGNFRFSKNIFKITHTTVNLSSFSITGKFVTSPALPVTSGYNITDNRFEKSGSAAGSTLNFNYVKSISVTDNSFVVTGTTLKTQQAVNLGSTGLVDAFVFSNNAVSEASTAIGGNRIAGAVISANKMLNINNAFANTNSMPESSNIEFSNNEMSNDLGTPFMLYTRNGTSLAGTSNMLKVENNMVTGVSQGNVTQLFGTTNFTINNSVLNPSIIIRGNKINYSGDFSSVASQTFRPITVRGNVGNTTIENNEVILNNSGGLGAFVESTLLPVNPAITIGTDNNAAAYMTAASVVNILNNKIQGYKQSVVFYDVAAAGHDAFTGYGNIPAGAVVNINNNSFTNDSISINNGAIGQTVNAGCNWYGTADAELIASKITPSTVNYAPWLTSGTDNNATTGFQPAPGTCNGRQTKFYVNDNSQAGDVLTTAVGNNSNNGFSSAPFATINYAISQAQAGDEIYVDAGLHAEAVVVNKSITLNGVQAGNCPGALLTRGSESTIVPASINNTAGNLVLIQTASVTIDGFTLDGDNPLLTSSFNMNGANVDGFTGITHTSSGLLKVKNNIIKNLHRNGIGLANAGVTYEIDCNHVDNMARIATVLGIGAESRAINASGNAYGTVTNNTFTRVTTAMSFLNNTNAASLTPSINNNTISSYQYGLLFSNNIGNASPFGINGNSFSKEDYAPWTVTGQTNFASNNNFQINYLSQTITQPVNISNNNFSGGNVALNIRVVSSPAINLVNNTFSDGNTGINLSDIQSTGAITISGTNISNMSGIGVFYIANTISNPKLKFDTVTLVNNDVGIDASYSSGSALPLEFNNTTITGGTTGLRLYGNQISLPGNVLTGVSFAGQSAQHILLTLDALTGLNIDATSVRFNGVTGAEMTLPQLLATEDKIVHKVDNEPFGFIRIKAGEVFLTENSFYNLPVFGSSTTAPSLERAINSAAAADVVNVGAGLYNTTDLSLTKALKFLGPNAGITPNDAVNKLLANAARNTEAIISGATFNIATANLTFKGFTFDPGNKSAFVLANTAATNNDFGNFSFEKNILKISNTTAGLNQFAITGKFVTSPALPVTTGYSFADNRFEKNGSATGNTLNFSYTKNISVTNNSFVVTGATLKTQQAVNLGGTGLVDAFVFSNNVVNEASTVVGGNRIAAAVISTNQMQNVSNAFANTNNMPESSNIEFSSNQLSNTSGNGPFILYNRNGTSLPGTSSAFLMENNTMTAFATPAPNLLFGALNLTINNSVQNPTVVVRGNKLLYNGDYSTVESQYVRPLTLRGNIGNSTIENNDIIFNNTGGLAAANPAVFLPENPGITIGTDVSSAAYMTAGGVMNIRNNKIQGFKQSVVFFDGAAAGHDAFSGFGNIPAGAVININENSFTNDVISINNGTASQPVNANCNWYGAANAANASAHVTASTVNYYPWLVNGTDSDVATGFQPVAGSCNGTAVEVVITQLTNINCNGANTGAVNVTISGGSTPYTFAWSKDNVAGFSNTEDLSSLVAGVYQLIVTDANGSADTVTTTITEPTALTASATGTNVSCFGNANGTATVNANGGTAPYTYLWSNAATTNSTSGLAAGNYTVTVTDAKGCTKTASYTVTQPTALTTIISGTNVSCFGNANGTATVNATGGTAPYTYLWSNAATTNSISGLAAGNYSVTVTDANGCTKTAAYLVTQPAILTVVMSSTSANCNGSATATPAGGTAPYSYNWSNGGTTQTIIGVPAGTYTVVITDANNCTVTGSRTITGNSPINPAATVINVSCFGGSNGKITVTGAGGTAPRMYSINGSAYQSSNVFANLPAGVYLVAVKDAAGCYDFVTKTITQPTALTVALDSANAACFATNNGRIYITANGGSGGKSYNWTGPNGYTSNTQDPNNLFAGTYNLLVTDANGCAKSLVVIVIERPAITISEVVTNVSCRGDLSGAINATVTGGSGTGFIYRWTGPNGFVATTQDINGIKAGNYTFTVTDVANGCAVVKNVTVTQPANNLDLATAKTNVTGCNSLGTITATGSGGTTPYQYKLNNASYQASGLFTNLAAGTYTVWIKDANGCTVSKVVIVTDNGTDEYEGNNNKNQAKLINIGTTIHARIAVANDIDWFKFVTPAGSGNFILSLTHPSTSFTFNMYPAGNNAPALGPVSTTATSKQYVLSGNSTYFISVTDGLSYVCYDMLVAPPVSFTRNVIPEIITIVKDSIALVEKDKPIVTAIAGLLVKAFPNPHQGSFKIQIESPEKGTAKIELFTITGQKLQQKTVSIQKSGISIVPFTVAQYGTILYRVSIGNKVLTGKILSLN